MKAFLDTSVLVATFYGRHEHHARSIDLFVRQEKELSCTAAHCLVEFYAVATGMPGKERASPDEAMLFLEGVQERLQPISLDDAEFVRTLQNVAAQGIVGGATYDAMIAECAIKVNAQTIYTWNARHFLRLGKAVASRVAQP